MKSTRTLDEAIAQGYAVTRCSYRITDAFYHHCKSTDHPYVRVRLKSTYATVVVDLDGQNYRMSQAANREICDLFKAYHVGCPTWGGYGQNWIFLYASRIPLSYVDTVAKGIVAILAKPGYRVPNSVGRARAAVEVKKVANGMTDVPIKREVNQERILHHD